VCLELRIAARGAPPCARRLWGEWLWGDGHGMTKAKVLGRKRVPYFMCTGIQGMTFQTSLHPNRVHGLLSKLLLGIADDLRRHFVSQGVVGLIVDRNVRQSRYSFLLSRTLETGPLCHVSSHQGRDIGGTYAQTF